MPSTYIPHHLVHAHLPAPPSLPNSIPELHIPTDREFPLDDEAYVEPLHPDHAVSVTHDAQTGILARSIFNSHVLELRTLDTTIGRSRTGKGPDGSEIVRIFFPDPLRPLAKGCITISRRDRRLYILLVSQANIVYRLNFPLGAFSASAAATSGDRFIFNTKGHEDWAEEWEVPDDVIAACGGVGAWTVLGDSTIVLGGGDGGIVKLTRSGHWSPDAGHWSATHHRATSRLRLPSLFSRNANSDEQVISFARFEKDDHIPLLHTLSRDRKLRTWNISTGSCLKTIDVRSNSQELVIRGSQEASSSASTDDGSVEMLRVIPHPFTTSRFSHLIIIFVSTPFNSSSAGYFAVYRVSSSSSGLGDLSYAGEKVCSSPSANAELRGFEIIPPIKKDGVDGGWQLWATWDKKGSIFAETIFLDDLFQFTTYIDSHDSPLLIDWQQVTSTTNQSEEFDAAYFDNILSVESPDPTNPADNGDIPAAFIQHLFHPGRFSALTLSTALEDYTLQLARKNQAEQSPSPFASLSKRFGDVVGTHIEMTYDSQTGAPVVDAYRKQLKVEWLGVWANVRDLDKQARWPITTTTINDQLVVLAREGVSVPIIEDVGGVVDCLGSSSINPNDFIALPEGALRTLYPAVAAPKARASNIAVSMAGYLINTVLKAQEVEDSTGTAYDMFIAQANDILARGSADPVEFTAGSLWDDFLDSYLSEDSRASIRRILSETSSTARALNGSLDILADTSFPLSSPEVADLAFSGLGNALLTSTISHVIQTRYSLAQKVLLVSLFYLSESRDPSDEDDEAEELIEILARALTTYHRYRALKWIADQTGEEARERSKTRRSNKRKLNGGGGGGDDILAEGLGSLRMRENDEDSALDTDSYEISYSLLHSLLNRQSPSPSSFVPEGSISPFSDSAASFITCLDLISRGQTDLNARTQDIKLAYSILADGHALLSGEYAELYPLSAGLAYIKGRAYLEADLVDDAVRYLEKAAPGYKDGSLVPILPATASPNGLSQYYRHITRVFDEHGSEGPVVYFGQLAIQNQKIDGPATKDLWTRVFLASVALGQYEEAYSILTSLPFLELKRDFLGQLISVMCENNEVGRLNSLGFIGFQKDVEEMLRFKARNSDPLRFPNYYKVLYSWHITRGDYRSAGEIMYLQGRRFGEGSSKVPGFELSAMQARSYLAAINALSLVDRKNAWVSLPGVPSKGLRGVKRRKVSSYIPEEEFADDKRPVDIISLDDIQMEYTLVLSQLKLSSAIPDLHEHGVSVTPQEVVGMFIQRGMFDVAQSAAASLKVDMTDLFQALAAKCVELSRLSEHTGDYSAAAFLQVSPVTCRLQGPPAALAMRYLQTALRRHDSVKTNWRYREIVTDTLFELNRDKRTGWQMPAWLAQWEMERDPEGWIGRALRFGWVEEALDWSADLLRNSTPPELLPKGKSKSDLTRIPYSLFDRVLAAAQEGDEKDDTIVQQKANSLKDVIQKRIKGLKEVEAAR